MRDAHLDINETTLVFEYPELYYLDINLCYKVDSVAGKAKFDKTKKTLTIRVPVVGSTDQSERVLEQHMRDYNERIHDQKERLRQLKLTKLDDDVRKSRKALHNTENENPNEEDADDDEENADSKTGPLSGVSAPKVINMGDLDSIDDKY